MKKALLLFLLVLSLNKIYAQTVIVDTTGYLRDSIYANRSNYIGHSLSNLLCALKLSIQFETTVPPGYNLPDTIVLKDIVLNFYELNTLIDRHINHKKMPCIIAVFSQPLKIPKSYFQKGNILDNQLFGWQSSKDLFYGQFTISDLRIGGL